jgi:FSR family fosmidomycin resistance protein-like MFS transporter
MKRGVLVLVAFALLAAFQAWASQNMMTFLPKYFSDLGQSATSYGFLAALYMGGSAVGNVIAGNLADRYGKRRIVAGAHALALIPVVAISMVGWSPSLYVLGGMALASGLILGFMFASGALGSLLSGYIADLWGFQVMFLTTAGLTLAGAGLAVSLPKT